MTSSAKMRPNFRRPPIFEQAISLHFEPVRGFEITDSGLFWREVCDEFPVSETGIRMQASTELFEGLDGQASYSAVSGLQLPRAIFRNLKTGEIIQIQDDAFVFNWVRPSPTAEYPRFERTSSRLWELYEKWASFLRGRHSASLTLRQCELTNVNVIPVSDFGRDFDDMGAAFKVDPFEWNVDGLVAETYIRNRVHRMVDDSGKPIGRLHSAIRPVFSEDGEKVFHFELTARSAPDIGTIEEARNFFERAHLMINGAFLASVTDQMRASWGEEDGE